MRLRIITPLALLVDDDAVASLRAEDASGGFGILAGHAQFLTSLSISVVGWKRGDGTQRYCAVRGGMFSVTAGQDIAITTREAVAGDDLATLGTTVLAHFREAIEQERAERFGSTQLQLDAIRRIVSEIRPGGSGGRLFA